MSQHQGPGAPALGHRGTETPLAPDRPPAFGRGFAVLTIGAVGVVYGDIGTSPLYALREALNALGPTPRAADVIGIVSLILWALIILVSGKYVLFLLRADNKGEGGTLSLLALARAATAGKGKTVAFALGVAGAAFFYGDAVITPAISVLSAVEGLNVVSDMFAHLVLPLAILILAALFAVQPRGTGSVAILFGPVIVAWFLALTAGGVTHIFDNPAILSAFLPTHALSFLIHHGFIGFVVLGAVFLVVTGAEALYADMGHFGRRPIQAAWIGLVLPALALNYLGQGALVMAKPAAAANPFFLLYPSWAQLPMVILATAATVIASQAVISGGFSITRQAIQLGLLPRLEIRHTSAQQLGQIYLPRVNLGLFVAVLAVVLLFGSSSALASAYGISVAGTIIVTTALAALVARQVWRWSGLATVALFGAFAIIEATFLFSNLFKFLDGGFVPLLLAATIGVCMWTWIRGTKIVAEISRHGNIATRDLAGLIAARAPHRAPGTAVFLTSTPDMAPPALLHNLKHNHVLHRSNVIMTIRTDSRPRLRARERVRVEKIDDNFMLLEASFGYMETPNVPMALTTAKRQGFDFDLNTTSFFLGRRSLAPSERRQGMPLWQDKLFVSLTRQSANPTNFFRIPPDRVIELGQRIAI